MVDTCALINIRTSHAMDRSRQQHHPAVHIRVSQIPTCYIVEKPLEVVPSFPSPLLLSNPLLPLPLPLGPFLPGVPKKEWCGAVRGSGGGVWVVVGGVGCGGWGEVGGVGVGRGEGGKNPINPSPKTLTPKKLKP